MLKKQKTFTSTLEYISNKSGNKSPIRLNKITHERRRNNVVWGFTLVEIIVVMGISVLIAIGLGILVYWAINLWQNSQGQVESQENARMALDNMTGIIREAQISDNGSYPIESAESLSFIFYSNIDDQSDRERVRYFLDLDSDVLKKGVIKSTGDPAEYLTENENVSIVGSYIRNADYIFKYYDGSLSELSEPIDLNDIRLIEIKLLIDKDVNKAPSATEVITTISFRNIKDM